MSLKPQSPRAMPPELAGLGDTIFKKKQGSPYRLVGDKLYETYRDEDYLDLYSPEGKPGLSPVLLGFVTVFQDLEGLSDREAANAVLVRLDWKYALHLPLDYKGFDFSVLSEYRQRLVKHGAEGWLFERLLADLEGLGVLKRHGRQRTDSLAVLTRVRTLNRLELVVETLRVAVREIVALEEEWAQMVLPPSWEERYGERCVYERLNEKERAVLQQETGRDGQWLLERLEEESTPRVVRELDEVKVLREVWAQQYEVKDRREVVFREPGPYDGKTRIQTPHDPEARYSKKRDTEWIGYKVQVTETDDEDMPHLITDIAVTSSVEGDHEALGEIRARQVKRDVLPEERLGDAGYVSGATLATGAALGEDLIGPAAEDRSPQARMENGITQAQFEVDVAAGRAECPGGQTTTKHTVHADGSVTFRFEAAVCRDCPLRAQCCTGKGGRTISRGPHYEELQVARARQKTDEFKQCYKRRGGVEGCVSVLVRGHGMRVCRYLGKAKNNLRALFVAAAVNLRRAARWLVGIRPQARRKGLGLAG